MTAVSAGLGRFARGSGPVVIALAVLAVAAAFLRAAEIPKWHTIWAEDGSIFAACAYRNAFPTCFATAYQGYLHLVPRLSAAISVLFDPRLLPLAITTCAAIANAVGAAFAGRAIAAITGSRLMGLLGGAGLVLVYQAGREVGGELGNAHLVLFAAAAIVLIGQWLGRSCDAADWLFIAVTGLTTAFAPALPVIALGGLLAGARRALPTLAVTTAAVVPQVVAELTNRRDYIGHPVSLYETGTGFWRLVVREGFFGPGHPLWGAITFVILVIVLGWLGILAAMAVRRTGSRDLALLWPFVATSALAALAVATWFVSVQVNGGLTPRYAYEPAALLVAALATGVGMVARNGLGVLTSGLTGRASVTAPAVLTLAVAAVLFAAFGATFRVQARSSYGPDATAELRMVSTCTPGTDVEIRISPIERPWFAPIPCDRLIR